MDSSAPGRFATLVPAALAAAALLVPATAEAKLTCDLDLPRAESVTLEGLREEPIAERHYEVTLRLPGQRPHGVSSRSRANCD